MGGRLVDDRDNMRVGGRGGRSARPESKGEETSGGDGRDAARDAARNGREKREGDGYSWGSGDGGDCSGDGSGDGRWDGGERRYIPNGESFVPAEEVAMHQRLADVRQMASKLNRTYNEL